MFPVEIWENILHKTEATTLLRLCTVNSTFNAIITRHLERSDAWCKQCEIDIPRKLWYTLIENSLDLIKIIIPLQMSNKYDRHDNKIWITLYKAWKKWINVDNFEKCVTKEFSPIPEHRKSENITCCSTLGELVAVGTSEGFVRVYNLITNKLVFFVDQTEPAESVKLWVQGKKYDQIIIIVTSIYKFIRVWEISGKNVLFFRRSGATMCAVHGYLYYCIGVHGNIITLSKFTADIRVHDVALNIENFCNTLSFDHSTKLMSMVINVDELYCLFNNGVYCELNLKEVFEENPSYELKITQLEGLKSQKIRNCYLFNPRVAFIITNQNFLGVSVDKSNWKLYNIWSLLEGSITAILYHFSLLVIGLNYGAILLFSIKDPSDLKKLDFKNYKKIQVSNDSIVSINTTELDGDQRLIITSKQTVYHINLQ